MIADVPYVGTPYNRIGALKARRGNEMWCGAIVTAGGLVFVGGSDVGFNAFDAMTGQELWSCAQSADVGRPMTIGPQADSSWSLPPGADEQAELVGLTLQ